MYEARPLASSGKAAKPKERPKQAKSIIPNTVTLKNKNKNKNELARKSPI
jgi:hypothetical protein